MGFRKCFHGFSQAGRKLAKNHWGAREDLPAQAKSWFVKTLAESAFTISQLMGVVNPNFEEFLPQLFQDMPANRIPGMS
jgi:hypothetical protein